MQYSYTFAWESTDTRDVHSSRSSGFTKVGEPPWLVDQFNFQIPRHLSLLP